MAESKTIKIIEICKVEPNTSPSKFFLPLTFLDNIWLALDPPSRLFFYEYTQKQNPESIVAKLKNSLSLTLEHHFPLAGHLTWPQDSDKAVVQYQTGDAISVTIAKSHADFHFLSGNEFRCSDLLRSLLPDFPTSETLSPVITLQITLFPNTGFCIGYVAHHAVMDGKSVSMFLHSWAYICKNEDNAALPLELTPFFDRDFAGQQEELERVYPKTMGINTDYEKRVLTIYNMEPPPDIMLGTFILTHEDIDNLKKIVLASWRKKNKLDTTRRISTFVVSTAYVMVCLTKAKQIMAQKIFMGINVNARARLEPPLPSNYFGNCVVWCGGWENTKDILLENGFVIAVEGIIKALSSLDEGLVESTKKLQGLTSNLMKDFVGFGVAGSPRFELYKVDFGWGKPKKVDMISIDKSSAFYISDNSEGNGGIEIGVALKNHEAEAFASIFPNDLHACYLA